MKNLRLFLERKVNSLLEEHVRDERIEFCHSLAHPVSLAAILELMSLPHQDVDILKQCIDTLSVAVSKPLSSADVERTDNSFHILSDYLRREIASRRREPRSDLVGGLIEALGDDDMVIAQCIVLMIGAYESTPNYLGSGTFSLVSNPQQLRRLQENPALTKSCIEEMMRFESPVQFVSRKAMANVEIGGVEIREGQKVSVFIGAANRDPAVFPDPDQFDITRDNSSKHLAFGLGPHLCIGAALARLEGEVVLNTMLKKYSSIRPCPTSEVQWKTDGLRFRGVEKLEVLLS